ncbi:uncharacterized protein LOC101860873 isoform X2 [Aplysia californica]|nr:uncharacterized protein LOC101860873 isoform X2 [Aplysia californica]XP_012946926.1 uncharacterized protein LOC101860873 isoform X2 [Aplysia californica]
MNKRSAQKSYESKKKMRFDLEKENTELMEMQKQLLQEKSQLEETHSLLELMYKIMKHKCNDTGSFCGSKRPGSSIRSTSPPRKDKQLVISLNEGPLHIDHSSLELGATVEIGQQQHSISSFDLCNSSDDEAQIKQQPVELRGKSSRRGHVGSVVAAY